jgi:glycine hydroxymethyltransferase
VDGNDGLAQRLHRSLAVQREAMRSTVILNPVENLPFADDLDGAGALLHGLYNSDKTRTRAQRAATAIQFAGREPLEKDARDIYDAWASALGAEDATLRLLSGLNAHTVLLMSMSCPGQRVLLLPTEAGGHASVRAIAQRLGLLVTDMIVDNERMCVDIRATIEACCDTPQDFLLVDRSEGLVVEDFSALIPLARNSAVFDASQYLSNVLSGDHRNPFDDGFDLVVASLHKNFPGPQKALLATRRDDIRWNQILSGVSTYVSNLHMASVYAAGLTLARTSWLSTYSSTMLLLATKLEDALHELGVPVVRRPLGVSPTHHLWIRESSREAAFETFERLEQCGVLTNFRQLPYSLGFGLRLGTSAVTRLGMELDDVPALATLVAEIRVQGPTKALQARVKVFAESLWDRGTDQRAVSNHD